MIKQADFHRWFNRDFWRAFKNLTIPIKTPKTKKGKTTFVENVYNSIKTKRYSPSIPETELVINKGYGVARTVPVFCLADYCVYYFCIKELEDVLCVNRTDNTFGGWTLGGISRRQETEEIESELTEYGRYSFNPKAWVNVFGEFNALLFSQLDQGKFSHVLQLDLSNFYDSIRLDILERWIREEAHSEKGWIVTLLFYLLNHWNRANTGLHPQTVGLPQDALADCSRILANYYLQKYDKFAAKLCFSVGGLYFRYADDQMILLNDPNKVEILLLLLTRNLDRYGLRVNQKKVVLWKAKDLERHRCRAIHNIFAKKGDNKNPRLVKRFAKAYLAMPEAKLEKTWNNGFPLLNRLLWAELESLPKKLFKKLMIRFISDQYLLLGTHDRFQRIDELNKKLIQPMPLVKRIKNLGKKCVHNAYHHEALAYAAFRKRMSLKRFFKTRLRAIEKQLNMPLGR